MKRKECIAVTVVREWSKSSNNQVGRDVLSVF